MATSGEEGPARRGPRGSRGVVRATIVAAARRVFATSGFTGTSMRDVADAAGVDARTVSYYFADRESLLMAVLTPPAWFFDDMDRVNAVPLTERGAALAHSILRNWSTPDERELLKLIVATSIEHPSAVIPIREAYTSRFTDVLAQTMGGPQAHLRAGLVAGAVASIAVSRFVHGLEPLASLTENEFVDLVGPLLQNYLDGQLVLPALAHA